MAFQETSTTDPTTNCKGAGLQEAPALVLGVLLEVPEVAHQASNHRADVGGPGFDFLARPVDGAVRLHFDQRLLELRLGNHAVRRDLAEVHSDR